MADRTAYMCAWRKRHRARLRKEKRRWYGGQKDRINAARREKYAETKDEKNATRRAQYQNNPTPALDYQKTHRLQINTTRRTRRRAQKDKTNAEQRQYRVDNLEHCRERDRNRRAQDRPKWQAYGRDWRKANPEKAHASDATHARQRRAALANAPINDLTHDQWLEIQSAQDHRCYYCGKRRKGKLTQDHLTPLSKGGSHTVRNVIAACSSCNSKKGTRKPPIPVQPFLLTVAPAKKKAS